jgi:hypothetical protein
MIRKKFSIIVLFSIVIVCILPINSGAWVTTVLDDPGLGIWESADQGYFTDVAVVTCPHFL